MATINRTQNPTERLARAVAGATMPAYECSRCSGTFFAESRCGEYSVSNYGVRPITSSPQTFYFCVGCGEPFVPQNLQSMVTVGGERERFLLSIEAGKNYKSRTDASKLIKNTASISELELLKTELAELQEKFTTLVEFLAESENESQEQSSVTTSIEEPIEKITRRNTKKVE
jgi:DNA-directed RNA polymerase subunit RPC12/RpoP